VDRIQRPIFPAMNAVRPLGASALRKVVGKQIWQILLRGAVRAPAPVSGVPWEYPFTSPVRPFLASSVGMIRLERVRKWIRFRYYKAPRGWKRNKPLKTRQRSSSKVPAQKSIAGPINANVTFTSPMTVGSTPMAIGFDLDMAHSVTSDANGNFVMNSVFHVTSGMQGSSNPMDFGDDGIQGMMGAVSSISGNSFTMTSMQAAQSFTFATNSSTVFANGSMGSMQNGESLMVDATLQADGSLMATRIQSMMNPSGMMGGGIITALTGSPASALTMVMQNGVGAGMMSSYFAPTTAPGWIDPRLLPAATASFPLETVHGVARGSWVSATWQEINCRRPLVDAVRRSALAASPFGGFSFFAAGKDAW
jgi:hypothetical protein